MAKKVFTDESLSVFISEIKSYTDETVLANKCNNKELTEEQIDALLNLIEEPSNPESLIDATLTKSGMAADSKTVGDRLALLEQMISSITTSQTALVYTTINLPASTWLGDIAPYYQVVSIPSATVNTKVDLQPTVAQLVEMQEDDIAFKAENDDGVITVYSINNKPEKDYTIHASLTEVTFV